MKSLLWWWLSSATSPRQADSPGGTLCCGHLSHVCISPSQCKLSSNTPEIDERQQQGQSVERCHVSTSLESGLTPIITWVMLDSLCVLLVSALRSPLSNSKNQTACFETLQPSEKKDRWIESKHPPPAFYKLPPPRTKKKKAKKA